MDLGYGAPTGHAYERWLLRRYAHRLISSETRGGRQPPRAVVARWLVEHRALLAPRARVETFGESGGPRLDRKDWARFAPYWQSLAAASVEAPPRPSGLERRIELLAGVLELAPADREIFAALARSVMSRPLRGLIQRLDGSSGDGGWDDEIDIGMLAGLLAAPQPRLRARLQEGAPLSLYGFVGDVYGGKIELRDSALSLLRAPLRDARGLRSMLIGAPRKSELRFEDYAHVEGAGVVLRLLGAAVETRARGVNILLYGPPGTGKSEFAAALGAKLGVQAIFAGESERIAREREPNRAARIGAIAMTGVVARQIGGAFVVVDEADDIFTGVDSADGARRRGSKAFMNRLVEGCETPTVWITNAPDCLGPAILRRMSYALRFAPPGRQVRETIVARAARKTRLRLDAHHRAALAQLEASPGVLANALRAAHLTGDGEVALACARSALRALHGETPQAPQPFAFDTAFARADTDLTALAAQVKAAGVGALSFCFHGPPGTGKSAFARSLARSLGLDVVEKRASDLLSKWLGDSEKLIRQAFEEAADKRAFLIFDEADSLLRAREGAQHSWEVTQVNEMLVGMERHPYPFACTTNAYETLDAAALRRFLFKVTFLPMAAAQIDAAFAAAFGAPAPADVLRLDNLTPGDFAVVARKAKILRETDAGALARWLREEAAAKPGARLARIGF